MRVLIVHNYYGSSAPSGENQAVEEEIELLRSNGHSVQLLMRHSDEIRNSGRAGQLKGALVIPWNPAMAWRAKKAVAEFAPDIVHVHNTFPLISPAVFYAVGHSAARVLTLHNYRLFCAAGIPMRDGNVCTQCLDKQSVLPAVRYGCYRDSRIATLPMALNVALHRQLRTWRNQVEAFIALSDFQRERMATAGLPAEKIHVKPNFYPGNPAPVEWHKRENCVIFAGRLTPEKGVGTLIDAWRLWSQSGYRVPELHVLGDGPLRSDLEIKAAGLPVKFFGQLSSEQAQGKIANSQLVMLPSECFEGFPMVLREAFAFGTPVAVSDLGPLPSIVSDGVNGVVFMAASPQSLLDRVSHAWQTPGMLAALGSGARAEFEAKYTSAINHTILLGIYEKAIAASRQRQTRRLG